MEFKLESAKYFYHASLDEKEMKEMESLGFTFEKIDEDEYSSGQDEYTLDGNPTIRIDSIEQLLTFIKEHGQVVVDENSITIYNDYLE